VPTTKPPRSHSAVTRTAAVGLLLLSGAGVLYWFDPCVAQVYPPCPLHYVTGLYCPGCGSLRALHQLLHGHVARAFALNPLLVVSLPLLAFLRLRPSLLYRPWVAWLSFGVLLTYGILRNLTCWPFALLAPR
jgi:hypothetical protein